MHNYIEVIGSKTIIIQVCMIHVHIHLLISPVLRERLLKLGTSWPTNYELLASFTAGGIRNVIVSLVATTCVEVPTWWAGLSIKSKRILYSYRHSLGYNYIIIKSMCLGIKCNCIHRSWISFMYRFKVLSLALIVQKCIYHWIPC